MGAPTLRSNLPHLATRLTSGGLEWFPGNRTLACPNTIFRAEVDMFYVDFLETIGVRSMLEIGAVSILQDLSKSQDGYLTEKGSGTHLNDGHAKRVHVAFLGPHHISISILFRDYSYDRGIGELRDHGRATVKLRQDGHRTGHVWI